MIYPLRDDTGNVKNVEILPQTFYSLPTLTLAQELLGKLLINETDDGIASGYIIETEAYIGPYDQAAHSYQNRRTKRTEIMFAPAGHIYTYVMHTHCLVNVVSGNLDAPEAVLIRALEPFSGLELMKDRRQTTILKNLTSGPGKLTKALGITMANYGGTITNPPLLIGEGYTPSSISTGTRIGIQNSGEANGYPWRFWVTNHPFVSK